MNDARSEDKFVFCSLSSFAFPSVQYKLEVPSGKLNVIRESGVDVDASQFKTEQIFFKSTDGTEVPMFLVYKKGMKKDGETPTLMYGYGGFNIAVKPGFSPNIIPFLEQGGMYVSVNLRGGSEYGETWHEQGMLENKQQVFDDFISAAEFLIDEGYTNPKKLGIYGRSNGGLLVGAVMTQRPDLFEVAVPSVGVLDMLRYHLFTIGYAWVPEYGSSDDEEQLKYLMKYSPYHNLKAGEKYPKTLVMTSMGDDRVVPYHSYKFAAKLQDQGSKENPYLLWVETKAGHGSGKSLEQRLDEYIARWSFVMHHLGMEFND
jgi:prolyl oligopeptidase